jgi:hypothetical protein
MRKFIFQLLYFLVLLVLLDRAFILFRPNETNLFNQIAREKANVTASKINVDSGFDAFVVGSSHAQFGVSPEMIHSKLKLKTLNLAFGGGANMGTQLAILKKLVIEKKIHPKLIIFGIDVFTLNSEPAKSSDCQSLLFNEKDNLYDLFKSKVIVSYFKLYSRFIPDYYERIKSGDYQLPLLDRDNHYDLTMFEKYEKYQISNLGWVKGFGSPNKDYVRYSKTTFNPNAIAIKNLEEYAEFCKNNNIILVLIQIPEHKVCLEYFKKYRDFNRWMEEFSNNYRIQYWDFNDELIFPVGNDSLFFDTDHLNKVGAVYFSSLLSDRLNIYSKYWKK